ncbi:hypothetical protein [Streptomyces chiangmaiensis]|uniref:Uncharacterized protein n=1 Tax=Streptomyces chiangmaiensis TaxID=766497 RepID=A0ABU7FY44_9ACTN|nr:hypothetical protein [Streptomyces chiangmaiensis]MED7828900.1 hypothetical protein [Streptomyces chiangmaiensis]
MATLVISACALGVSVIALIWQFISWLRNGPVIKVSTHYAIAVIAGNLAPGDYLAIAATNRGRAPTMITSWGLLLPGNVTTASTSALLPGVEPLPHRLDPYAEASWYIEHEELDGICRTRGITRGQIRPLVIVSGQGRKVGKPLR